MADTIERMPDLVDTMAENGERNSAGLTTEPPMRHEQPKLKGRKRLMQSLKRISSSQSITRFGRSSSYRGTGQGSMSCISLSSTSFSYGLGTSYGSQTSNGYSTAPTSVPSTPGIQTPANGRVRFVHGSRSRATSIPVPFEAKTSRPGTAMRDGEEDYFSHPLATKRRRHDFDFWRDMPFEIRMHILGFLTPREIVRCSGVSKAWQKDCFDGQLWSNMDTADFYSDIPAAGLVKLVKQAGPFVRDLNLRGCVQLRDIWRPTGLPDACSNLENLSLEGCAIDKASIHKFFRTNPRLVHVNLSGLRVDNTTMNVMSRNCSRLQLLNVSWCPLVDTRGLLKVVESCPGLRDLRASEIAGFDNVDFMKLLFDSNMLERLILVNCNSLTNASFEALIEGTEGEIDPLTGRREVPPRKLRHLDVSRCQSLSDDGLKALVGNVPLLEGLQLGRCRTLTDSSLTALLPTLPLLTHLDLEELEAVTNATLEELARSPCAANLQHLSISYCENLGDAGMLPVIKACPQLRNLDLDNTKISDLVLAEAAAMVRQRCSYAATGTRPRAITWDGASAPRSSSIATGPAKPKVGLRMVVYDCQNVTWTGIREVLSRNAEIRRPMPPSFFLPSFAPPTTATTRTQAHAERDSDSDDMDGSPEPLPELDIVRQDRPPFQSTNSYAITSTAPSHPHQIISLKVFYGYQPTVTEHTRRVLRGDLASASRLERKWAEYMMASEEAGAAMGAGNGNGLGRFGIANGIGNATVGLGVLGNRRRRRRVREAQMLHADEEEGGAGSLFGGNGGRRRRARSGGCAMM